MAFVMNGVIIPEDTANAFSFNGSDVTDVFMNGVQVFNQSLFSATWSGDSYILISGVKNGIETSGALHRIMTSKIIVYPTFTHTQAYGGWITSTSAGLGAGTSQALVNNSAYRRIVTTSSSIKLTQDSYESDGVCGFTVAGGFTGSSLISTIGYGFKTSGGLIRYQADDTDVGAWISLT